MGVLFHSDGVDYSLPNSEKTKSWLEKCISLQNKKCGDINVIFCNDDYLQKINEKYLQHTDLTDVITFDHSHEKKILGDIYISIERVKENALIFKTTFVGIKVQILVIIDIWIFF